MKNIIYGFIALLLVSDFFKEGVFNPFSISYFQEITLGVYLLSAMFFLYKKKTILVSELILILIPPAMMAHSSVLAWVNYDQPLLYGFIEERRDLQLYSYFFLLMTSSKINKIGDDGGWVVDGVLWVSIFVSAMGLLYFLDIFKGFKEIEYSAVSLRQGRANISSAFIATGICFSFFLVVWSNDYRRRRLAFISFVLGVAYVLLVNQTRQVIGGVGISCVVSYLILEQKKGLLVKLPFFFLLMIFAFVLFSGFFSGSALFEKYGQLFVDAFSEDYLQDSSRAYTTETILNEMTFWGRGALSLMYSDGFSSVYGDFFFLADVGVLGTVFRYGLFSFIYICAAIYFIFIVLKRSKFIVDRGVKAGVISSCLLLFFLWPFGAILEYKAAVIGLLLAFTKIVFFVEIKKGFVK